MIPMKEVFLIFLLISSAWALPNSIFVALDRDESPLDGVDLTAQLLASAVWDGLEALPGDWSSDTGVAQTSASYLRARPKIFGVDSLFIRASHRNEKLEELQVTFVDAGSFFGYAGRRSSTGKEGEAELQERLATKKAEFSELYRETLETLTKGLSKIDDRPKDRQRGRTRDLRAEFSEYRDEKSGLVISLLQADDRLIRISIQKEESQVKTWLDASQEKVEVRDRLKTLAGQVSKTERGDLMLDGVSVVPQGFRPYCGLNTLVMVGRYFGLHLDEDWLAVAGKFENTGSAEGSDMLGLYNAVAKEARFRLNRKSSYDHETVRRSIRAGMPVIVWRRWDRERDRLHSKVSREFTRGSDGKFERPDEKVMPSKKKGSPLHASVVIGYNDERKEIIFLESWNGDASPRRMPVSEIAHTADLTFAFQP